ncbi:ABC transporter ATP-binding protein [Ruthenibacterium lactatiformans]|uniref:ABC transporter ATP-binding protein n=1 Tax=Ruthenibacterium lactatiformans TaxID=1550024 RepID=UPI002943B730|nr:ABC transporter ATP-binding protein [Ruthenibacterium lactatiformans]
MEKNDIIMRAEHLSKYFKVGRQTLKAVDDVSFTLQRGTTLGLVGESGSGKSTLARLVLDLIPATKGRVEFEGQDFFNLPREKRRLLRREMQIVFQNPFLSLFPHMSVSSNIAEPFIVNRKEVGKLSQKELNERVEALMALVGVPREYFNVYPHELSGGQQQRVGIARALALNPKLIICDEPVSSLDVSIQAQILNLLQDLQAEKDLSYIFIAHNLAVVEHISTHVAVMYLGKLVEYTDTYELYNHPLHPYTRALMESVPQISTEGAEFHGMEGEIPSPLNPPRGCRFCTRCPKAMQRCHEEEPAYREVSPGHCVACHLYE